MTNFPYDETVPTTGFNPSTQYTTMQQNYESIQDILDVDHITLAEDDGGTHKQLNFKDFGSSTLLGGDPASLVYPDAGVIDATKAQLYFKNSTTNSYPLSLIKAYALFVAGTSNPVTIRNQYNVSSITNTGTRQYTIALNSAVVSGNFVGVIALQSNGNVASYTFSNPNLVITTTSTSVNVTVVVLQI